MLTAIVLSIAVPSVAGTAYLALRSRLPGLVADVRGIALQTVIIMVVLLAIAGAIAAVLITRGNQAATDLASQNIGVASLYASSSECVRAGFSWNTTAPAHCS